jgi:hypothetical protein
MLMYRLQERAQAEIDDEIAANVRAADEAEAAWRRRQDLLAG